MRPEKEPAAPTSGARVAALRERRAALGLVRLEVYAHPEDHPAIKAVAQRLTQERACAPTANSPQPPACPKTA